MCQARATTDAIRLPNNSFIAATELVSLFSIWAKDEMQIGGIHVAVGKNRVPR